MGTDGAMQPRHRVAAAALASARTLRTLLVVAVAACAVPPEPAAEGEQTRPVPELVDADDLVERHRFVLRAPDTEVLSRLTAPVDEDAVVVAPADDYDVRVVWTGLPCQVAPTVRIEHDDVVVVIVDRGPEVLGPGEACESSEAFHVLDLRFGSGRADAVVEARVR